MDCFHLVHDRNIQCKTPVILVKGLLVLRNVGECLGICTKAGSRKGLSCMQRVIYSTNPCILTALFLRPLAPPSCWLFFQI